MRRVCHAAAIVPSLALEPLSGTAASEIEEIGAALAQTARAPADAAPSASQAAANGAAQLTSAGRRKQEGHTGPYAYAHQQPCDGRAGGSCSRLLRTPGWWFISRVLHC